MAKKPQPPNSDCPICGSRYLATAARRARGFGLFCSRACDNANRREKSIAALPVRFWAAVNKAAADECWPWQGLIDDRGYGYIGFLNKKIKAHRLSYEYERGPVPDGMFVCHRCDNPPCVNPAHLFAGTCADNNADMIAKRRNRRGERHPQSRLTAEIVLEMRAMRASGSSYGEIGSRHGVTHSAARHAVLGKTWGHVSTSALAAHARAVKP